MIRNVITFLFCCSFWALHAQDKLVKELEKQLDQSIVPVPSVLQSSDAREVDTLWSQTHDSVMVGKAYKGEFVQYALPIKKRENSTKNYITLNAVSKAEFLEFRQWIIDSSARMFIYHYKEDSHGAALWLNIPPGLRGNRRKDNGPDFDEREEMLQLFSLNWDRKLDYSDPYIYAYLSELYVSRRERFRRDRVFDYRNLYYRFGKPVERNKNAVPIRIDSYKWVEQEDSNFGPSTVAAFLNDQILLNTPVTFIEPFMAEAYCDWKSKQLNKQIKEKNIEVHCRLPRVGEIESVGILQDHFTVSTYNHTDDWRITNREFRLFCESALDSICREKLYQDEVDADKALSLIDYKSYYFSDDYLEYIELDPYQREENRSLFNLSNDKLKWSDFGYLNREEFLQKMQMDSLLFRYEWIDAKARSRREGAKVFPFTEEPNTVIEIPGELIQEGQLGGKEGFGTIEIKNVRPYILQNEVYIPLPESIPETDALAALTYAQALAYYNWKFRIDAFTKEDNWQQFVFPSEEEFDKIQQGETLVYPANKVTFQEPIFRMVVEIIEQ